MSNVVGGLLTSRTCNSMMITRACNLDPIKPHFNIVKLAFTGVYIFLLYFRSKTLIVGSR